MQRKKKLKEEKTCKENEAPESQKILIFVSKKMPNNVVTSHRTIKLYYSIVWFFLETGKHQNLTRLRQPTERDCRTWDKSVIYGLPTQMQTPVTWGLRKKCKGS